MPDFNTFRINEELLGRFIAARRRDCTDFNHVPNKMARIVTTPAKNKPKDYHAWFKQIQNAAKDNAMSKLSHESNTRAKLLTR